MGLADLLVERAPPLPELVFEKGKRKGEGYVVTMRDGGEVGRKRVLYFSEEAMKRIQEIRQRMMCERIEDEEAVQSFVPWYQRAVNYFF